MTSLHSVYIHIPFCKKICPYCDFCKVLYNSSWVKAYLPKLKEEILDKYMGEEIRTIYIGGGTPSALSLEEIEYLLNLTNIFKKDKLKEFTFECNIEDINPALVSLLIRYGVTRVSLGIESFSFQNYPYLKRITNFEEALKKVEILKEMGITNINVDLIYALPKEDEKTLKEDLNYLLKLNVPHISTYSLMVQDNTYLGVQKVKEINEDLDYDMYNLIQKVLTKNGYIHYELSNYAKEGYESLHNLVYWSNLEYYGFGCGASGYVFGVRYDNTKSLTNYLKGDTILHKEILDKLDIMKYELILNLRKTQGLNIREFYDKYAVNVADVFPIKDLLKTKELLYEDGYLKINPNYFYVMNEILIKLV